MLLLSMMVLSAGGCASLGGKKARSAPDQETVLAGAVELLKGGNEKEARTLLEQVVSGSQKRGVADEALFRLALLYLRDEGNKGNIKAQKLLEQLAREYPNSSWTRQSAPLSAHLTEMRHLRENLRELKSLREQNYSLSRDNKELRQTLERLKSLDLELEQKIRH